MKKLLIITALFLFLTIPVSASNNDIETTTIEADPGFVSLTEVLPTEEISFDLIEFKELDAEVIDVKITFKQSESNASSSVLNLKNSDDQIIKAVSTADPGEKDFLSLKRILTDVIDETNELVFTLEGQDIDPDTPLYLTSVELQIGYELIDIDPPEISEIKVEEITPDSVLISWKTDEDAFSRIKYGKTSNYSEIQDETLQEIDEESEENVDKYTKEHSALLLNLFSGTTYHFQIVTEDRAGNVSKSSNKTILTPLTTNESTVLGSSTDLLSSISNLSGELIHNGSYKIDLKWSIETNQEYDGFLVYRQIGNSVMQQIERLDSFETTFSDSDLLEGQVYKYIVRSYKGNDISPQSNIYQVEVSPTNLDSGGLFINIDINKIILFVGALTIGALIIFYFFFTRIRNFIKSFTTERLGQNKLKDASYVQSDFEKRFTDSL